MTKIYRATVLIIAFISLLIHKPNVFSAEDNPQGVNVAVLRNWPPHYLTDNDTGKPIGFAIDVLNQISEMSGIEVRYVVYDTWPDANEGFKNDEVVLFPNMGITDERIPLYDFTTPYETFRISIFVRSATSDINEVSDLIGRKVGVVRTNQGLLLMKKQGGSDLHIFDSPEEIFLALLSANIDAFVYPEQIITRIALRSGLDQKIKIIGEPLGEIKRGIAIKKGNPELMMKLDNAVRKLVKSPEYQMIYQKWYGRQKPYWDIKKVIIAMSTLLGFSIAGMLFWRYVSIAKLNHHLIKTFTELQKIKDNLNDAILRQNEAVKASNVGLWDWDLITDKVLFSPEWKMQIGYQDHEISNDFKEWEDRVHPDDLAPTLEKVKQSIAKKSLDHQLEFRFRHKDGSYIWILTQASVIQDESGNPIRMVGSHVDITKRRQMEDELRENEQKFRNVFETSNVGKSITLTTGEIFVNTAFADMLGYSREELLNKNWQELTPPDEIETIQTLLSSLLNGEKDSIRFKKKYIHKDGEHVWADVSAAMQRGKDGTPLYYITTIVDITERIQAEKLLKASEEKFYHAFHKSPVGLTITRIADGKFIDVNDSFLQMFEFSREEVVGHTSTELKMLNLQERDKLMNLQIESGGLYNAELQAKSKSGRIINIIFSSKPMELKGEAHHITTMIDITEKKDLESRLQQAQKMEEIGNLAGGIAHDFNNILSSIIGYTELALNDVERNSLIKDDLQEVYTAGNRAKELVAQILAFARQSEEELRPIQVDTIIDEVLKFIRSSIPTSIEIKKDLQSESLIIGNQTQVHQIIMNLCTNAAHAMESKGGTLNVTLSDIMIDGKYSQTLDLTPGDYIVITTSDTGPGIKPEIIGSIFSPYFTTKEPGEGTGMGLALVRGIVESYGGKVFVDSKLGNGTTFTIYLPVTRKRKTESQYEPDELPTGTEKILFVDDEASITKMGSRSLRRIGYHVTTRTSSIEALELFRSKPVDFDLVITDMTMPNLSGDMLTIELLKIKPDLPVILCTGFSKIISEESASQIGIKALLYKPIINSDLAKTVRKVLDEQRG